MQQSESGTPAHRSAGLQSFDLVRYLEIVVRRKRLILGSSALALVCAVALSLLLPKIYSATALILPPQQQERGMMGMLMGQMAGNMAGLAGDLLGKGSGADMYVTILKSNAAADALIDRFQLMQVYDVKYRLDAYRELDEKVTISAGAKDGVISISVEDRDPKRAADMANAYVEELRKTTLRLNITGAGENRTFLEERLVKAKTDLAGAEDALKAFQSSNQVVSVTDQASAAIEAVAKLKAQLASQEVQLAGLQRQFTDSSQEVKSAKALSANLRRQIAGLEGSSAGSIPGVGSVPELGQQYLRLMREFKVQETLVELLTKQYELAKLSEAKNVDGVQVIQQARVPDKKAKPRRAVLVLSITCAAGFLALVLAFALEYLESLPPEEQGRWRGLARGLFQAR